MVHGFVFFAGAKFVVFFPEEIVEDVAVPDEIVVRDAETAACGALVDRDEDYGAGAGYGIDLVFLYESLILGGAILDCAALAPDAYYFWGAREGYELCVYPLACLVGCL
jgi:hypothetical protein